MPVPDNYLAQLMPKSPLAGATPRSMSIADATTTGEPKLEDDQPGITPLEDLIADFPAVLAGLTDPADVTICLAAMRLLVGIRKRTSAPADRLAG